MKARDIFGIILRSTALWIILWGAWYTLAAIVYLPATLQSFLGGDSPRGGSIMYLTYGVPAALGGILLLRFANAILWFTYRD